MRTFWTVFSIRLQLLRLWFIKNFKTFLITAVLIYLILVFTGRVDGGILFGFLNGIIENIKTGIGNANIYDTVMNIIALGLSTFASVMMFIGKAQSLTVTDIKSRKLKEAIIAAGLFFNSDGKLVKRIEMYTQTDISEDGKIVHIEKDEVEPSGSVLGIFDAAKELFTITTAKIEIQNDVNDIIEDANLSAIKAMDDHINEEEVTVEEKTTEGAFKRMVNGIKKPFKKGKKRLNDHISNLPKETGENLSVDMISDKELKAEEEKEKKAIEKAVKASVGTNNTKTATYTNSKSLADRRKALYGK